MGKVAKNTVFKVDNSSAALTDISTKCHDVKFPRQADSLDSTTFQQGGNKTFQPGLKSGTISISFNWDSTIDAHLCGVLGQDTLLNFEYGPNGSASGEAKKTGTCFLSKYEPPAQVGQLIKGTAEFQISGAVTDGTYT
jgi:hypothetical protein